MTQFAKDVFKYFGGGAVLIAAVFFAGFFIGRARPPDIKTILLEDVADREYIERYHVAGSDEYQYILHKEYVLDVDFITPF